MVRLDLRMDSDSSQPAGFITGKHDSEVRTLCRCKHRSAMIKKTTTNVKFGLWRFMSIYIYIYTKRRVRANVGHGQNHTFKYAP